MMPPSGARPTTTGLSADTTNRRRITPSIRTDSTSTAGRGPASVSFPPCRGQLGTPALSVGGGWATGLLYVRMSANGLSESRAAPNMLQLVSGHFHTRASRRAPIGDRSPTAGTSPRPTRATSTGPPAPGTAASNRPGSSTHGRLPAN